MKFLAIAGLALLSAGCSASPGPAPRDAAAPGDAASGAGDDGPVAFPTGHPDRYWLERMGRGRGRLDQVCGQGRNDLVARRLCAGPTIDGLTSLYAALGLVADFGNVAIATQSSGLGHRTTSLLNPRAFLQSPLPLQSFTPDSEVVVAFSRGEQLVELVGFDKAADQLNFYLLSYRQACNAVHCSTRDLLSPATEAGWTDWSLYTEADLEDTPLDCLSCHQPAGRGTPRRLLMRDFPQPWTHWLPLDPPPPCLDGNGEQRSERHPRPDLRAEFARIHAAAGGYAGLLPAATANASGHNLHTLVFLFGPPELPRDDQRRRDEPFIMDARAIEADWRCDGANLGWQAYRRQLLGERGLPVPYYKFDVLDGTKAAAARADLPGYLAAQTDRDPFDILSGLVSEEAQLATGATVAGDEAAADILRQACTRCHDRRAPPGSVRARFDVEAISPAAAAMARRRLSLPADSPYVMPPRRASALSPAARTKLDAHLRALE